MTQKNNIKKTLDALKREKLISSFTEDDAKRAVETVKYDHDPIAAKNLIDYYYFKMSDGLPFDQEILNDYIYFAFEKMINENCSADHAFGLKLKRGKYPRKNNISRDVTYAAHVILNVRKGIKVQDAMVDAALLFHLDGSGNKSVEKAYSEYRSILNLFPDEWLAELAKP